MSRIDRALRIHERGKGTQAASPEVDRSSEDSPLLQYNREDRSAPITVLRRATGEPAAREPALGDAGPAPRRGEQVVGSHRAPNQSTTPRWEPASAEDQARLVTGTSSSVAVEQYRKLAALLHEEQVHSQLKTVMVTSALPGEGKTLTVVNLALTLSESYARRVLIVDADLRGPSMHRAFGLANERGLSEALREDGELSLIEVSPGLSVLAAGDPGRTPLAGLTSQRMGDILEECASRFDWVLVDTPPIGVLPDAQVLARLAGAVIFVIGAGSTPSAAVERAIAELGGADAILGVVLNRVEQRRIPEAGYYGRYQSPRK